MGDSTTITVSTELGDVIVKKMVLADYAELLRAIDQLPEALQKFAKNKSQDELKKLEWGDIIKILPGILADAWPDFAGIVAVPTDQDRDFLLRLDGPDAFDVIDAVLELNDIGRIAGAIKKMQARIAKVAPQKPKASS